MQYCVCLKADPKSKAIADLKSIYSKALNPPAIQCQFNIEDLNEVPKVGEKLSFDFPVFLSEEAPSITASGEVCRIVKRYIEPDNDVVTKCIISCEVTIFSLRSPDKVIWHYRGEDGIKSLNAQS